MIDKRFVTAIGGKREPAFGSRRNVIEQFAVKVNAEKTGEPILAPVLIVRKRGVSDAEPMACVMSDAGIPVSMPLQASTITL